MSALHCGELVVMSFLVLSLYSAVGGSPFVSMVG